MLLGGSQHKFNNLELAWLRSNMRNTNRTRVSIFESLLNTMNIEDVSDDRLGKGMVAKTGGFGCWRQFSIRNTRMSIYP